MQATQRTTKTQLTLWPKAAGAETLHIIIKNGRCTLKGLVTNKADSDYAHLKAHGVAGLFKVKNELQIEKASCE